MSPKLSGLVVTNPVMHISQLPTPESWLLPLQHYTTWARAAHHSPKTIGLRTSHVRAFARWSSLDPFAVTLDVLLAYLGHKQWGKTTRASHRASLRSFYAWALVSGHVSADPTRDLPRFTVAIGQPRPAPESAFQVALGTADPRVRLMVELAGRVGMRCGEIAQAHTDDLRQTARGWDLLIHGKGDKPRTVHLNARLCVILPSLPRGYLFPGQIDGHLSPSYVSKLVSAALPDGWTAHTLRHRFATRAYSAERDILAVRKLLGHASVATTQIYTAMPDDATMRAVEAAA